MCRFCLGNISIDNVLLMLVLVTSILELYALVIIVFEKIIFKYH